MRTLLFFILLLPNVLFGQSGIKGYIKNKDGKLPFANIFVKEISNGTSSNEDGYYEYKLKAGKYTVIYQYLGYQSVEKQVEVKEDKFTALDVELAEQSIVLKEVIVKSNNENPAYTIMRKAIAKSEYHLKQVKSYEARLYLKGAGQILDMPKFIEKQIEKDADETEKLEMKQLFITEQISDLSFEMPNKYKQKVISVKSTGKQNNSNPSGFIETSLYAPVVNDVVSPLSPSAFSYYRFSLEGSFRDQNVVINKIKVTPFSRGEDVFEGFIYIIDDLWCLHSVDLKTKKFGFDFKIDEVFSQVEQNVWLPTTYKFFIKGGIIGVKVEYTYVASLSNYKIVLNPLLIKDVNLIDEKLTKLNKKELPKDVLDLEEKLASGKEIRRKDFTKYMKNLEKEEDKRLLEERKKKKLEAKNKTQEPLLVKEKDTLVIGAKPELENTVMIIDSLAHKRDESFWNEMRPVPLSTKELESYKVMDSIKIVQQEKKRIKDSTEAANPNKLTKEKKNNNKVLGTLTDLLVGSTYRLNKTTSIELLPMMRDASFNAVEGWAFNAGFTFKKRFMQKDSVVIGTGSNAKKFAKEIMTMRFTPIVRYSFARETAIGHANLQFEYRQSKSVIKRNLVDFSIGRSVAQFNEQNPIPTVVNTFYAYSLGKNYIKLYEKDFIKLQSLHVWHKTFSTNFSMEYAERSTLENNTNTTLTKRENFSFEDNNPKNEFVDSIAFSRHNALIFALQMKWNPLNGFRLRNTSSLLPELTFDYKKGLNEVLGSNVDYDFVQLSLKHEFEVGVKRFFGFSIGAGAFLNKKSVFFPDFVHFLGNRTILQTHDRYASFRILDYYTHSTADKFVRLHAHYQFRKLLITQITPIRFMGWKERAFVNYLAVPQNPHYVEIGYGIDNIFRFLSLEGIVSFQGNQYQNWGIRVGISGLNNMSIFN